MNAEDGLNQEGKRGKKNQALGRRGEACAALFLERKGYEVLERNWTCLAGEADIIALDGCCLVFCEVKTRTSLGKGLPCEAVTPKKRQRYEKIAAWYLKESDWVNIPVRFDVIDLLVVSDDRAFVRHIVGAYEVM